MFTGVIEAQGKVKNFKNGVLEITLPKFFGKLKIGSSVAVDGVCLTLVQQKSSIGFFDVVAETQARTTLGSFEPGQVVNLERPLQWQGRVEGHFVLGHVDGVGIIRQVSVAKKQKSILVETPKLIRRFVCEKGSIAANGVSLTIGKTKKGSFWLHLIPQTLKSTNLGGLAGGSRVNLEADMVAKLLLKRRFN